MSSVVPLRSSSCQSPDLVLARPFPSVLTTVAFDHSRRRWFGTCPCRPVPRGLPSSVKQLHTTQPFSLSRSWRTMVGNPSTNAHRPQGFGSDRAAPTCHTDALRGFLHDVPNRLYRHAISPRPSYFVDPAEQPSSIDCGCGEPIVQFGSHPNGNRNRSNVACLAHQINNGPMLFALLER